MASLRSDLIQAIAYFALASAAVLLTRLDGGVALLWIANAVPLAALCGREVRDWTRPLLGAAIGGAAATVLFGSMPAAAPGFALANVGETALAALVLRRFEVGCRFFDTSRTVMLVALAAVLAAMAGGLVGATTGVLAFGKPWPATWLDWVIGHTLGVLIAAPVVLLVMSGEGVRWLRGLSPASAARAALLLGGVAVVAGAVFGQNRLPLLFLPMLPVLVATFQLGQAGAAVSLLLVAAIGGVLTSFGYGPVTLIRGSDVLRLQFFQVYLASTFLICLPVAGALSQRERLMAAVRAGEARYRLLADSVTDVILDIGLDGAIRYASPAVHDVLGVVPESLVGRGVDDLLFAEDVARVRDLHRSALRSPGLPVTAEFRMRRADGETGWFESRTRTMDDGRGGIEGVVSILREVSDRKALEQHLRKVAETDPLTGLANRRAFLDRLEAAIAASGADQPVSVAIVDVDFFKRVNDDHGHAAGDVALLIVADICRASVRVDDLVARLGGEEFALLLPGAHAPDAVTIGERLRETLAAAPIPVSEDVRVPITASVGAAEHVPGEDGPALLARADRALYRAKAEGRNRLVLDLP